MALLEARLGTVGFSRKDSVSVHSQVPKPRAFPGAREGLPVAPFCEWKGRRMIKKKEGSCALPADNPKQKLYNSALAALATSYLKERLTREQSTFKSQQVFVYASEFPELLEEI